MNSQSEHIVVNDEHLLDASFLVVYCEGCQKPVMTARELSLEKELIDVCIHCQRPLSAQSPSAQWVGVSRVIELGYFVDGVAVEEEGCSSGGCRGGACGVRQPKQ